MENQGLVNLLKDLFHTYKEYENWINIVNPFLPGDNRLLLGIRKDNLFCSCFKSGYGAPLDKFLSDYLHDDIRARELIREYGLILKEYVYEEMVNEEVPLKNIELPGKVFDDKLGIFGARALNYLIKRDFDINTIRKYQLRYVYSGEFNGRIIIPFFEDRKPIYYLGRSFIDSSMRYQNLTGVLTDNIVFNIDNIQDEVFINEGVFDAMYLKNTATAMLTKTISKGKVKKILSKESLKRVCFVPDNDPDKIGFKFLFKNIDTFKLFIPSNRDIKIGWYIPEKKDLNDSRKNFIDWNEIVLDSKINRIKFRNKYLKGDFDD